MKRRACIFLVFLLLGAIVNVAVAWGCAFEGHPGNLSVVDRQPSSQECQQWATNRDAQGCFGGAPDLATVATSFGVKILVLMRVDGGGNPRAKYFQMDSGWPVCSFSGHIRTCWNPPAVDRWGGFSVRRTYRDPDGAFKTFILLPFVPIWPGFAINTLCYAAILWLLFAPLVVLRRRRRIKRGLCPKCAYPVGESDVCTECGNPHTMKAALKHP